MLQRNYIQQVKQNKETTVDINIYNFACKVVRGAVRDEILETFKELLKPEVNVNELTFHGTPLLHNPLFLDIKILRDLIKRGADVNLCDRNGVTPLHVAVSLFDRKAINELLLHGSNINLTNNDGNTPLMDALEDIRGSGCVRLLLRFGADANIANHNGVTPLHKALFPWNGLYVIRKLLQLGAIVNVSDCNNETPLQRAVRLQSDMQIVKELLKHGARCDMVDKEGNTVLHLAVVHSQSMSCIRELLAHGADINAVNYKGRTVLHEVCLKGKVNMLKELHKLSSNINIADKYGETPLDLALRYGYRGVIEELLKYWDYLNLDTRKWNEFLLKVAKDIPHCKLIIKFILIHAFQSDYTDLLGTKEISQLDNDLACYFKSCISELLQMKKMTIVTGVSLFDFVTTKDINIALYSDNEGTKDITVKGELFSKYPIYHDLVFPLVKPALHRGVLITKLKEISIYSRSRSDSSHSLGEEIHLNDGCITLVAKYLSNHDLRCLAQAFRYPESRICATAFKKRLRKELHDAPTSKRIKHD